MQPNFEDIWETYARSWKVESREEKLALYKQCLHTDCVYTDPLMVAKGWDELADYMLDFHRQIPGGHFVTTWFLAHHQCSIAKWEMRGGNGAVLGEGISYGTYNSDNKLTTMTGFFETP